MIVCTSDPHMAKKETVIQGVSFCVEIKFKTYGQKRTFLVILEQALKCEAHCHTIAPYHLLIIVVYSCVFNHKVLVGLKHMHFV